LIILIDKKKLVPIELVENVQRDITTKHNIKITRREAYTNPLYWLQFLTEFYTLYNNF